MGHRLRLTICALVAVFICGEFLPQILPTVTLSSTNAFAQGTSKFQEFLRILDTDTSDLSAEDQFCKSKIFNTISKETCVAACPTGPLSCVLVNTHKADQHPELSEDLECFTCDASYSCYDLGLIYGWFDCMACEANPDKMCVQAIGGGVPGIPSFPLPKDSDGVQCWDCKNRPDTCFKHWPGSTVKSTCDRACRGKVNHKCVKVGKNPDDNRDCYVCRKNPPPPKTCYDFGTIYKKDCGQCKGLFPVCDVATGVGLTHPVGQVIKDEKGNTCYDCYEKKKTCEQQGLKTKCRPDEIATPVVAPNGAKCFTCAKKPKTCSQVDPKLQDVPCKCKAGFNPVNKFVNDGTGKNIQCCECVKDPCHPDLNAHECYQCTDKGMRCHALTRERGKPQCYQCRKIPTKEDPPKVCEDVLLHESCRPNPCPDDHSCEPVEVVLDGKKKKCAECVPEPVDPTACETHTNQNYPQHRFANCAPCFRANMACDEKVVSTDPALTCAKCLDPVDYRCEKPLRPGQCIHQMCADGVVCENVGQYCHQCRKLKGCSEMNLSQQCQSDEICTPVVAENGEECCQCTKKNCRNIDKTPQSICSFCKDGQECRKDGQAPNGEQCYRCVGGYTSPQCDDTDGWYESKAKCDADCLYDNRECQSVFSIDDNIRKTCWECREKHCESQGKYSSYPCDNQCGPQGKVCRQEGVLNQGTILEDSSQCWICDGYKCEDLPERYSDDACGGRCDSQTQECSPITDLGLDCWYCRPKAPTCDEQQGRFPPGVDCRSTCKKKEICAYIPGDDSGCEGCRRKTEQEECREYGVNNQAGSCPQQCPYGLECRNTQRGCHTCTCSPENGTYPKGTDCGGTCPNWQQCLPTGHGLGCEHCVDKPLGEYCKAKGGMAGQCATQECWAGSECVDIPGPPDCFRCKEYNCAHFKYMDSCHDTFSDGRACADGYGCEVVTDDPRIGDLLCFDCKPLAQVKCDGERAEFPPGKNCLDLCDTDEEGEKCVPIKGHPHKCETCLSYMPLQCRAGKGELPGPCPGQCKDGQTCVPVGDFCHSCCDKDQQVGACPADGKCANGGDCTPMGNYCHVCGEPTTPPPPQCDPEKGERAGGCNGGQGSCSDTQECADIQGKPCHACNEVKDCEDKGWVEECDEDEVCKDEKEIADGYST